MSLAQENAGTPSANSTKQAPEAIAGAKKEFQAIKSARDAALQPQGELPRLRVPDMPVAAPAAPSGTSSTKRPGPEAKSNNWLVEAMEKKSDSRTGRERNRDELARIEFDASDSIVAEQSSVESKSHDGSPNLPGGKAKPAVVNPLTRYLGEWMTPKDYALLRPGLQSSLAGAPGALFGSAAPVLPRSDSLNSTPTAAQNDIATGATLPLAGPTPLASPPPRENPYLLSLNSAPAIASVPAPTNSNGKTQAPISAAGALAPTMEPDTNGRARSGVSEQPAEREQPKPKVPEFVKPANDEKYFKQLKRF